MYYYVWYVEANEFIITDCALGGLYSNCKIFSWLTIYLFIFFNSYAKDFILDISQRNHLQRELFEKERKNRIDWLIAFFSAPGSQGREREEFGRKE